MEKSEERPGNTYRLILIVINLLFILMAIAIIAAGIWFFIERNYMSAVMQSDLFSAASIILFVPGIVVFIISFMGCFGAYRGLRILLFVYVAICLFMVLLALCAAFVAAAFSGEITGIIRSNMNDTLIRRYGNNTHNNTINRVVTQAWDRMQVRLNCCAVDTEGWEVYQASSWYQYRKNNNVDESEIALVPESCCRRATYDWDIIINEMQCRTTQGGPPRTRLGSPNHFLNYEGCYQSAKTALNTVIWVIFGFGFFLSVLIIIAMVSAVCLAIKLKKAKKMGAPEKRYKTTQDY